MNDARHQNAVKVAEKALEIAGRHPDPRVQTIAIFKRPIAHIAATIADQVADEVARGTTHVDVIARGIFNDLYERACQAHATDVVEQLIACASYHPNPAVKSIALLKRPAADIVVRISTEVNQHVKSGIHQADRIARSILNSLLGE